MEMDRKLFIFDVGGVVIYDTPIIEEFSEKYKLDYDEVFRDWMYYNKPLMDGYLDVQVFYRMLEHKYGIDLSNDNMMLSCYHPQENLGVKRIVRMLREAGHRVVTGSNTFAVHWEYLKSLKPSPLDGFDHLYASHEMHFSKPEKAFFQYIMKAEGFEPGDSYFFDDSAANVEVAASLGMTAYNYRLDDDDLLAFLKPCIEGNDR